MNRFPIQRLGSLAREDASRSVPAASRTQSLADTADTAANTRWNGARLDRLVWQNLALHNALARWQQDNPSGAVINECVFVQWLENVGAVL